MKIHPSLEDFTVNGGLAFADVGVVSDLNLGWSFSLAAMQSQRSDRVQLGKACYSF
jgi:hypothetical protein